jgi:hypothetical protein
MFYDYETLILKQRGEHKIKLFTIKYSVWTYLNLRYNQGKIFHAMSVPYKVG